MLPYNKRFKFLSRQLRKNMTETEHFLWNKIRHKQLKGHQFYRQKILGPYIVDFYCAKAGLVIELDGGQHYTTEGKKKDSIRKKFLEQQGIKVLRFSDTEVFKNTDGIMRKIWENLP